MEVRQPDDPNSPVFGSSRRLEMSVVELLRWRQIVKENSIAESYDSAPPFVNNVNIKVSRRTR
jgi:hypothetical protein